MRFSFLIYVSRSGSTLFAKKLAQASGDILVVPESRVIEHLLALDEGALGSLGPDGLLRYLSRDVRNDPLRPAEKDAASLWEAYRSAGRRGLLEEFITLYSASVGRKEFKVALLKWGQIVRLRQQLRVWAPEAHFIHVYRDPRGVANSMCRSRRPYFPSENMGRGDPVFIGRSWARFQDLVSIMPSEGWPVWETRYEDFCRDMSGEIGKVLAFLGVSADAGGAGSDYRVAQEEAQIHQLVDGAPVPARADAWRSEAPRHVVFSVEWSAGKLLEQRGYFREPAGVLERSWFVALGWFRHVWKTGAYYLRRLWFYGLRPRALGDRLRLFRARRGAGS